MPFLNPKRVNKGPASGEVSYSTSSRNGNRANGNHLDILGLRIGLFCEIFTKRCQKRPIKWEHSCLPQKCRFSFRENVLYPSTSSFDPCASSAWIGALLDSAQFRWYEPVLPYFARSAKMSASKRDMMEDNTLHFSGESKD